MLLLRLGRAWLALGALVMTSAAPTVTVTPLSGTSSDVFVVIKTDRGEIMVDLDRAHAPVTVANFLRYVDQRRFDGTTFYRAMHLDWGEQPNGLVQGGINNDPRRALKPIAHEPTDRTGILHKAGTLSMARFAPGTATGDFSILLSNLSGLDANPASPNADEKAGFAAFGHVVDGMDVVQAIWDAPRSASKGAGVMHGQMFDKPVKILSVRRTTAIYMPMPVVD